MSCVLGTIVPSVLVTRVKVVYEKPYDSLEFMTFGQGLDTDRKTWEMLFNRIIKKLIRDQPQLETQAV